MCKKIVLVALQVIDYYAKKNVVATIHAEKPPKDVTEEVKKHLAS